MIFYRKKGQRWLAVFILMFIPVFVILAMLVYTFFLPETISLKAGQESTIDFFMPFSAEIVPENVQALSVNSEPVTNNIKVNFSKPATFLADTSGKWSMKLSLCGLPIKTVQVEAIEKEKLVAGGEIVGIKINTNGVLVLGTGDVKTYDDKYIDPSNGKVKTGDLIQKVNNNEIQTKEELIDAIETSSGSDLNLTISRKGDIMNVNITPVISQEDGKKKLGLWVRDSTQGIGTLTYYDNQTNSFGALGHPVTDVDTGELMEIKDGNIYESKVVEIKKGTKGEPGQITGEILAGQVLGQIHDNNNCGIYGVADKQIYGREYEIALKNQVKTGKASILSYLEGRCVEYEIEILAINTLNKNDSKGMIIKITDERLLEKTGGIVQGMSGSPIIQNGKLIGAVTHVFIQDPTKGYGIFIENML